MNLHLAVLLLLFPAFTQAQSPQSKSLTAPALLKQVAANYAQPGDFHIEVIEESTSTSELRHDWHKAYRTAIRGTGNRFRVETRSPFGSWTQISDGTSEWIYWVDAKRYVKHPISGTNPYQYRALFSANNEIANAWNTITFLESLAAESIHATRMPDETISLDGHTIACYVVHAEDNQGQSDSSSDRLFWIDKQTHVFRKIVMHNVSYIIQGDVHIPYKEEVTETYPVLDINTLSPDNIFHFTPPSDAKLVDRLEPEWLRNVQPSTSSAVFKPHPAPEIQLEAVMKLGPS